MKEDSLEWRLGDVQYQDWTLGRASRLRAWSFAEAFERVTYFFISLHGTTYNNSTAITQRLESLPTSLLLNP